MGVKDIRRRLAKLEAKREAANVLVDAVGDLMDVATEAMEAAKKHAGTRYEYVPRLTDKERVAVADRVSASVEAALLDDATEQ